MEKVYIEDKQGNKVLPKTHVSAVYDDDGNDLGSHLGAFEDEVRGLVDTPHQEYVTVATYASLPASGSEDTIYRVSNYDGSQSQVAADVYSEYAWDGTQYVFLCVKGAVGEVFDISAYHSNVKYADLNAALTSNTGGVPQSLQKGGMSIKFVQSSDNNYVQARCMANEFTTDVTQWQGVDDELTPDSDNLAKSGTVYEQVSNIDGKIGISENENTSFAERCGLAWSGTKLVGETSSLGGVIIKARKGVQYSASKNNLWYRLFSTYPKLNSSDMVQEIQAPGQGKVTANHDGWWFISDVAESAMPVTITEYPYGIKKDISEIQDEIATINGDISDVKDGTIQITKSTQIGDLLQNQYYRADLSTIATSTSTLNGTMCKSLEVSVGDTYRIYGNGPTDVVALCVTTDSERVVKRRFIGQHRPLNLTIENGESYIFVNLYQYNSETDKIEKINVYTTNYLYDNIPEGEPLNEEKITRNWFWKGKKVVIFGDSITKYKPSYSDKKGGWVDEFTELSDALTYSGAISGSRLSARRSAVLPVDAGESQVENEYRAYNSLDVVNLVKAWASNSWTVVDTNVAWLASTLSDDNTGQIQNLKNMPIENTDVVIISAGTNDWHGGSADGSATLDDFNVEHIYGALNNIVKDILSANTKVQIYFLTPIPRYTGKNVPTFSAENNYYVGDIVKYSGSDYIFESAHAAGAWDANEVRLAVPTDFRQDEYSSDVVVVDGRTLKQFSENEINFVHKYHIPILDMYNNIGFNKYNWSNYFPDNDNTHPAKGLDYIGKKVYSLISCL